MDIVIIEAIEANMVKQATKTIATAIIEVDTTIFGKICTRRYGLPRFIWGIFWGFGGVKMAKN